MLADRKAQPPRECSSVHRPTARIDGQTGLTLLEVLIALIVLSVGLIGVAALTLQSLQNVHSSLYTSLASAAALDYEERLWLEAAGLADGFCPSGSGDFFESFLEDWTAENAALGLPTPGVAPYDPEFDWAGPQIFTTGIEISWAESRFREPANRELFRYVATAPCRRS